MYKLGPVLLLCTEIASEADLVCSVPVTARRDRVGRGDEEVQQFRFAQEGLGILCIIEGGHKFPLVHCSLGSHPGPERWLM